MLLNTLLPVMAVLQAGMLRWGFCRQKALKKLSWKKKVLARRASKSFELKGKS